VYTNPWTGFDNVLKASLPTQKRAQQFVRMETTRMQNLICRKSGRYYARAFTSGKQVWKPLYIAAQRKRRSLNYIVRA
jgi:hypothetical protein